MNRRNFFSQGGHPGNAYPPEFREEVRLALMEAWAWLEREALLIPRSDNDRDWVRFSRAADKIEVRTDFDSYRKASLLSRDGLHPRINVAISSSFLDGRYDTAVFEAFRAVEVEVRSRGKFAPTDLGVKLMREAFAVNAGPLADAAAPAAEQQATSDLFAGAIGTFKNPASHRLGTVEDPEIASEMIGLASLLMRMLDKRL